MVSYVHVEYRREIPFPLDEAYAWLTDYDDQDHERTDAIITNRRVKEKRDGVVVLEAVLDTVGRHIERDAEVDLMPPDRWRARALDPKGRKSDVYEYRLEPRGDDRCELIVDYNFIAPKLKHKLKLNAARPLIRRELEKMWDGFLAAMQEDLDAARRG